MRTPSCHDAIDGFRRYKQIVCISQNQLKIMRGAEFAVLTAKTDNRRGPTCGSRFTLV